MLHKNLNYVSFRFYGCEGNKRHEIFPSSSTTVCSHNVNCCMSMFCFLLHQTELSKIMTHRNNASCWNHLDDIQWFPCKGQAWKHRTTLNKPVKFFIQNNVTYWHYVHSFENMSYLYGIFISQTCRLLIPLPVFSFALFLCMR